MYQPWRIRAMSDYTHLNLKEIEDQAPRFGLSPDLEFRMARVPLEMERAGVSYLRLGPGFRIPFGHNHKQQEEVYVVVAGSGRIALGDGVRELAEWDAVRVHKDAMRGFEAGPEGMELIVVGAPNTGPGDANTEQGWWPS
jgi:mannose-6-phosphate isomerase-like protein (cupin superfamily)